MYQRQHKDSSKEINTDAEHRTKHQDVSLFSTTLPPEYSSIPSWKKLFGAVCCCHRFASQMYTSPVQRTRVHLRYVPYHTVLTITSFTRILPSLSRSLPADAFCSGVLACDHVFVSAPRVIVSRPRSPQFSNRLPSLKYHIYTCWTYTSKYNTGTGMYVRTHMIVFRHLVFSSKTESALEFHTLAFSLVMRAQITKPFCDHAAISSIRHPP